MPTASRSRTSPTRNYTENGLFWNGVLGYRASYVTAYRNGDYGLFAFDSQWGVFEHSYASGSPDSGFYIGQCDPCHAVITDVTAEYNQLGYSGTNAGGDLFIVRSVWRNNRTGIVPNSFDFEALAPQGDAVIAGNLIETNGSADAAKGDDIWDIVYGVGIGIIGGSDNQIIRNHLPGNAVIGIAIAPNPGLGGNFPATGNVVRGNNTHGASLADLATVLVTPDDRNCFADNEYGTSAPANIEQVMPCEGAGAGDPNDGALPIGRFLDTSNNPAGRDYKDTPVPPKQRNMANAVEGARRSPRARRRRSTSTRSPVRRSRVSARSRVKVSGETSMPSSVRRSSKLGRIPVGCSRALDPAVLVAPSPYSKTKRSREGDDLALHPFDPAHLGDAARPVAQPCDVDEQIDRRRATARGWPASAGRSRP